MKKVLLGVIASATIFGLSFSDTLILTKKGKSTYIQQEEFVLTKGNNIIGPIYLQPIAETEGLNIFGKGLTLEGYIIENEGNNWQEKLKGKQVSIEGEGRIIKGKLINIKNGFVELNSKQGFTITTLPKFPSRLRVKEKWEKVFAPKITLKIKSNTEGSNIINISYPVKNLNWNVLYVLKDNTLEQYIIFINKTPLAFDNVDIELVDNSKVWKRIKGILIPPFTEKRVRIFSKSLNSVNIKSLPKGKVVVYKNNIFKGYKKLDEIK